MAPDLQPPLAGGTRIVVTRADDPVLLDLATGALDPAPAGATFWCRTRRGYDYPIPYGPDGEERNGRLGGALASICDAHGQPAAALPDVSSTVATGARAGDMVVIATADGFVGLRVR